MAAPQSSAEVPSAARTGAASTAGDGTTTKAPTAAQPRRSLGVRHVLSLPPRWLNMYGDFIAKNASQVSQIESALRSLTYVIPGRFRDAEIASETVHSGVQLLSLYHDSLLQRASSSQSPSSLNAPAPHRTIHARYTAFWSQKSSLYRRVALALQVVQYTQLLIEMAAKRRGDERLRWRVVVLVEAFKAFCKLVLLRITRGRPLVAPALPERQPIPLPDDESDEAAKGEYVIPSELRDDGENDGHGGAHDGHVGHHEANGNENSPPSNGHALGNGKAAAAAAPPPHTKEWHMPRTRSTLPSLPASDINSYLLSRVLTADDIKPAPKLLHPLTGTAQAAEVLQILAPLVYAMALAHFSLRAAEANGSRGGGGGRGTKSGRGLHAASWAPWALGVALSLAARQLRDRSLRTTALEREEWSRRGWALGWWAMRGAAYDNVVKGVVEGVRRRVPNFVGGILEDYEYLWENYYFSTAD